MISYAGSYPDKTLSVSQCLGSRSGRRPTVMTVMVGPVFIPRRGEGGRVGGGGAECKL